MRATAVTTPTYRFRPGAACPELGANIVPSHILTFARDDGWVTDERVDELAGWVADGSVVVLSGAGLSTDSGIPDYRGPSGAARRTTPMTYQAFTRDPVARRRYWARSHLGWRTIGDARPNAGHRAVARLEELGRLDGIITQNVDGLHQAGGAHGVIELHGNLSRIRSEEHTSELQSRQYLV